jgi:hypothetical protein
MNIEADWEYNYNNMVFLRGSIHFIPIMKVRMVSQRVMRLYSDLHFGAGFYYPWHCEARLDYAYRVTERFDANQWFSLTVGF